jgi:hypothetical protein
MLYIFDTPDDGLYRPKHVVFYIKIVKVTDALYKAQVTQMPQDVFF